MSTPLLTWPLQYCLNGERPVYDLVPSEFWRRVKVGTKNECWEWQGGKFGKPRYGEVTIRLTKIPAHKVAWMFANDKEVPDGYLVMHKCDNPPCCNPYHLKLGTPQENVQDMLRKRRGRWQREGENVHTVT